MIKTSAFQQAIETVEALSSEEQAMLIEIIQNRLREQKRQELLENIAQSERDYSEGKVKLGSVDEFLAELDEDY